MADKKKIVKGIIVVGGALILGYYIGRHAMPPMVRVVSTSGTGSPSGMGSGTGVAHGCRGIGGLIGDIIHGDSIPPQAGPHGSPVF